MIGAIDLHNSVSGPEALILRLTAFKKCKAVNVQELLSSTRVKISVTAYA